MSHQPTEPDQTDPDPVLATAAATMGRRVLGLGALALLGVLMIYLAFSGTTGVATQIGFLVIGAGALWLAEQMRQATAQRVELTRAGLRDSDGTVIARLDEIEKVDRGILAFKPSNGFVIKTKTRGRGRLRPGLWWRVGRMIGVGGMTPVRQTKLMAELLADLLVREAGKD